MPTLSNFKTEFIVIAKWAGIILGALLALFILIKIVFFILLYFIQQSYLETKRQGMLKGPTLFVEKVICCAVIKKANRK